MNTGLTDIAESNMVDLTEAQMRLWSGQMLNPDKSLYNMVFSFEIKGKIDTHTFQRAFEMLQDEYDVLRSVIVIENDLPKQSFSNQKEPVLAYHDFSEMSNPDAELAHWIDREKKVLFAENELLYRSALIKLASEKYVWYLNQHHLITDGWSYINLYNSLEHNYRLLLTENGQLEKPEQIKFEDFAKQHSFLSSAPSTEYWLQRKEEITEAPALYGIKTKTQKSNSVRLTRSLGTERTAALKALCQEEGIRAWTADIALNNIFLTVVNALIYKISGQSKFDVGMPSHNRLSPRHKKTAGLFMELMPVMANVTGEDSLLSLYKKSQESFFEVAKQGKNKPPVELLRGFNAVLNFIPQHFKPFAGNSVKTDWIHPEHHDPGHHLRLQIHDFDNRDDYLLLFDLNTRVLSEEKREAIVAHFFLILDAFISNKEQKIGELEVISEEEITKIDAWNASEEAIPENEAMISAFEDQVIATPDAVALTFGDASLTYRQFDEKANQVANFLKLRNIKAGDVVGIQIDRSLELICCLYGVLKLGAVYLPLDVDSPSERTRFVLKDAGVKMLFTNDDTNDADCPLVTRNEIFELIATCSNQKPESNIQPDDTAYIIYTSGSTGNPKGVVISHKAVCNKLRWRRNFYPLVASDAVLQKTPITFDISIWELFWPLQVGARLVIAPAGAHKDSAVLITLVKTHQVTNLHLVPSMLNAFLAEPKAKGCTMLKRMFCVGEALHKVTVDNFHDTLNCELYNMYGPTEASLEVTHWLCEKDTNSDTVPIGFTTPNTRLYVLNDQLKRVAIGTPGELYIAGVQLAKEYLNLPEMTAERFLPDAYGHDTQAKMYKTGDLARYLENGALEYLGRTDSQIKLRGFRVELGEIEVAMMRHIAIDQAAVIKIDQDKGRAYLVGYYTGKNVEENELRSSLSEYLPDYMIPSFFVFLDEFELSTSGKLDRKKLPVHSVLSEPSKAAHVAPETQLQELVAGVWEDILQIENLSIYDRFTDLGGDSLKALMVTSRIKEMLELNLSVHLVFAHPDILSYANHLEKLMIEIMSMEEDE